MRLLLTFCEVRLKSLKGFLMLFLIIVSAGCTEEWEKHILKKGEANALIERFNRSNPSKQNPPKFFSRADIDFLTLNNTGVRYYLGQQNGQDYMLLVGTRSPTSSSDEEDDDESKIVISPIFQNATRIPLNTASVITREFQTQNATWLKGGFFHIGIFNYVKTAPGYSGVNFYFGQDVSGQISMVGRATRFDSAANRHIENIGDDAKEIDMSVPCPDNCGTRNQLNHE